MALSTSESQIGFQDALAPLSGTVNLIGSSINLDVPPTTISQKETAVDIPSQNIILHEHHNGTRFESNKQHLSRLAELKQEMRLVLSDEHPIFLESLVRLENLKNEKLWTAKLLKDFQLDVAEKLYIWEKRSVEEEFENEKANLREKLTGELLERKKRLEEKKEQVECPHQDKETSEAGTRSALSRKLRRRGELIEPAARSSARKKNGSSDILLTEITETEIFDDVSKIFQDESNGTGRRVVASQRKPMLSDAFPSISGNSLAPGNSQCKTNIYEASFNDGQLYYSSNIFEKGDHISVETIESGKFEGWISSINSSELWIRKSDSTRVRMYISQLRQGRVTMNQIES